MEITCLNCGETHKTKHYSVQKYCSVSCQKEFQYQQQVKDWLEGKEKGWTGTTVQLKSFVRRWLYETRGTKCEECGWDKRHPVDDSILLEVDHIDGDASNCTPDNLKILCPNCHAMTPTFRRRNKSSVRQR